MTSANKKCFMDEIDPDLNYINEKLANQCKIFES